MKTSPKSREELVAALESWIGSDQDIDGKAIEALHLTTASDAFGKTGAMRQAIRAALSQPSETIVVVRRTKIERHFLYSSACSEGLVPLEELPAGAPSDGKSVFVILTYEGLSQAIRSTPERLQLATTFICELDWKYSLDAVGGMFDLVNHLTTHRNLPKGWYRLIGQSTTGSDTLDFFKRLLATPPWSDEVKDIDWMVETERPDPRPSWTVYDDSMEAELKAYGIPGPLKTLLRAEFSGLPPTPGSGQGHAIIVVQDPQGRALQDELTALAAEGIALPSPVILDDASDLDNKAMQNALAQVFDPDLHRLIFFRHPIPFQDKIPGLSHIVLGGGQHTAMFDRESAHVLWCYAPFSRLDIRAVLGLCQDDTVRVHTGFPESAVRPPYPRRGVENADLYRFAFEIASTRWSDAFQLHLVRSCVQDRQAFSLAIGYHLDRDLVVQMPGEREMVPRRFAENDSSPRVQLFKAALPLLGGNVRFSVLFSSVAQEQDDQVRRAIARLAAMLHVGIPALMSFNAGMAAAMMASNPNMSARGVLDKIADSSTGSVAGLKHKGQLLACAGFWTTAVFHHWDFCQFADSALPISKQFGDGLITIRYNPAKQVLQLSERLAGLAKIEGMRHPDDAKPLGHQQSSRLLRQLFSAWSDMSLMAFPDPQGFIRYFDQSSQLTDLALQGRETMDPFDVCGEEIEYTGFFIYLGLVKMTDSPECKKWVASSLIHIPTLIAGEDEDPSVDYPLRRNPDWA